MKHLLFVLLLSPFFIKAQNTYVDLAVTDIVFVIDTAAMEMDVFAEVTNLGTQDAYGFDLSQFMLNDMPGVYSYTDSLMPSESRTYDLDWGNSGPWDLNNFQNPNNEPFCVGVLHSLDTITGNNQMCDSLSFLSASVYNLASNISIYPNPSNGSFSAEITPGNYTLTIVDAAGRVLLNSSGVSSGPAMQIDIPQAKSGMYIVRIETESGVAVLKLMVE